MSPIAHHPSDAMLTSYAAGALGEGLSLIVASHVSMCANCADRLAGFEAVGGALLEDLAPSELGDTALKDTMTRIDKVAQLPVRTDPLSDPVLPNPVLAYTRAGASELNWLRLAPGLKQVKLFEDSQGFSARLLRISAGKPMPRHGHAGMELTLVLEGGYWDEAGSYQRGDIAEHDEHIEHRPVADRDQDCICLVAANAPVRLRSIIGRLFQPLVGM